MTDSGQEVFFLLSLFGQKHRLTQILFIAFGFIDID